MANEELYTVAGKKSSRTGNPAAITEIAEIAIIRKSQIEAFKLRVIEMHGRRFADLRVFYTDASGELCPSRKGVAIGVQQLREIIPALLEAERRLAGGEQ